MMLAFAGRGVANTGATGGTGNTGQTGQTGQTGNTGGTGPPPPILDLWTRLDPGTPPASNVNSFFTRQGIVLVDLGVIKAGDIVSIWDAPSDVSLSGLRTFSRLNNEWTVWPMSALGPIPAGWPMDGFGRPTFRWENCGVDWADNVGMLVWSTPTPTDFTSPANPETFVDLSKLNTGQSVFTQFAPGCSGGDQMFCYWNGRDYLFGMASDQYNQIQTRQIPNGPLQNWTDTNIPPLGSNPNFQLSGADMGTHRGQVDHRTGLLWLFNNDNELYMRSAGAGPTDPVGWYHVPTVGTKPSMGAVYCLHEARNCFVAWTGDTHGQAEDGFPGTDPQTTYILDLGTLVWRLGPSQAGGQTVPVGVPQTGGALLYDRTNQEVKYIVENGLQVWRLDVAGTQL